MSSFTFSPNFSSDFDDHSMGPPTIFIVFAVLIIGCIVISCVVRCCQASGAIDDPVANPPPVQVIYPTGSHNVYPNHVLDLEAGSYVAMAATPQFDTPMAVVVSSVPPMDTSSTPSASYTVDMSNGASASSTATDSCSAPSASYT